jgi:hypothetical protein
MARFYKGVKVGSYLHDKNLFATGIAPANPGGSYSVDTVIRHVGGDTYTPCVSLTKSYGIAQTYALDGGTAFPDINNPAWVYEIQLDKNDPSINPYVVVDPIFEISRKHNDPLVPISYHHDGDHLFLIGIVDEQNHAHYASQQVLRPRGATAYAPARTPHRSEQLEAYVRVLRDAEVMFVGTVPAKCIVRKHPVYYPLP